MSEEESGLMLDVGQANELKMSFRRNGYTETDVKGISKGKFLGKVLGLLHGKFKLVPVACAVLTAFSINCDALPSIPEGLKIHNHIAGGVAEWNKEKYSNPDLLHLVEKQKIGTIGGYELHARLAGLPVANACYLDWLMDHKYQIPESQKKLGAIFFWGTIYSGSDGGLCVRYLYWYGGKLISSYFWLEDDWNDRYPALLASIMSLN